MVFVNMTSNKYMDLIKAAEGEFDEGVLCILLAFFAGFWMVLVAAGVVIGIVVSRRSHKDSVWENVECDYGEDVEYDYGDDEKHLGWEEVITAGERL